MEKFKQYKYIILIIFLILGFAFYWYSLRPTIIKEDCYNIATNKATERTQVTSGYIPIANRKPEGTHYKELYDINYKLCLQEKGL